MPPVKSGAAKLAALFALPLDVPYGRRLAKASGIEMRRLVVRAPQQALEQPFIHEGQRDAQANAGPAVRC
jgi:hypothetical protein